MLVESWPLDMDSASPPVARCWKWSQLALALTLPLEHWLLSIKLSDATSKGVYSTFILGEGEKRCREVTCPVRQEACLRVGAPHDCPTVCLVTYVVNDFLKRSQRVSAPSVVGAPQWHGGAWKFTWVAAARGHSWVPGAVRCSLSPQILTEREPVCHALFRVLRLFLQTEQLKISLPSNRLLVAKERMEGWIGRLS